MTQRVLAAAATSFAVWEGPRLAQKEQLLPVQASLGTRRRFRGCFESHGPSGKPCHGRIKAQEM
ncbi:MAG: hypothetical protein RR311_10835 [Comamonas sp.]